MAEKKIDRRVQRTQQLLGNALVDLILDKGYKKITVQEIIDRANVGRSTFYAHFQDKEDLLARSFGLLAEDLYEHMDGPHPHTNGQFHFVHSRDFILHADQNRPFYRAMMASGGEEVLLATGRQHIEKNILAHLEELALDEDEIAVPLPVLTNFLASTLLDLIMWWIEEAAPYSPDEIEGMFERLCMPGVRQLLDIASP